MHDDTKIKQFSMTLVNTLAKYIYIYAVAVLEFSFWGATGVATLSSGGHTTNTFVLNYRVCNHLCQIINT